MKNFGRFTRVSLERGIARTNGDTKVEMCTLSAHTGQIASTDHLQAGSR